MDPRSRRVAATRLLGTVALGAALLVLLLSAMGTGLTVEPLAVVFLLTIVGTGLRIEAAVLDRR